MGAIAGPSIIVMMLTAMEHDLQSRISTKMDAQMLLSQQSIFLGNQKAMMFQQLSTLDPNSAQYKQMEASINAFLQKEKVLQSYEKTLDMELKQLQTQLEITQKRKEAEEKRLQQNIKTGFSYTLGN